MPVRSASITPAERTRAKISVTLMLISSARQPLIVGRPCLAAGILTNRLGRLASHHSALASATVRPVSRAIRGSASIDAVHAAGRVVHRAEHVAGPPQVEGGQFPQRLVRAGLA
jgi:hypothetical protein